MARDRRHRLQFGNQGIRADVARVQNVFHAREQFKNLRVEKTMGVFVTQYLNIEKRY